MHFVLLKAWTEFFGNSEFAVRSLSALVSIGCVPLIYALGCRLGAETMRARRIGLAAAALLAVAPAQIFYAHEGRAYALLPLFLMLAMLGLCRSLQGNPGADARPGLALYVGAAVALLYSHAIAVFILLALVLAVGLTLLDGPMRAYLRGFVWANLAVGLLALPQAVAMAVQAKSANLEWMEPFGLDTLIIANRYVMVGPMVRNDLGATGSHILLLIEMFLALAASLTLLPAARKAIRGRLALALVLVFPLLFIALTSGVSVLRPILIPRVGVWLGVPISLAAAFVLTADTAANGAGRLRLVASVLFAGCLGLGLWDNVVAPAQHKPHWPELAHDNPAGPDAAILVAAPHAGPLGLDFYAGRNRAEGLAPPPVPLQWVVHPERAVTLAEALERRVTGSTTIGTDGIEALVRGGRHVTLFCDDDDLFMLEGMKQRLAGFGTMRRQDYPGLVVLSW